MSSDLLLVQEIDKQLDLLRDQLRLAHTLIDRQHAHLADEAARARERAAATEAEIAQLLDQRAPLSAGLVEAARVEYQRARERFALPPWVVVATGHFCAACGHPAPVAEIAQAARNRRPCSCGSCGRLMVIVDGQGITHPGRRGTGSDGGR